MWCGECSVFVYLYILLLKRMNSIWRMNRYEEWPDMKNEPIWRMNRYEEWTDMKNEPIWRKNRCEEWTDMKNEPICKSYPRITGLNSKTVPWFSPMYKEGNESCFIYTIKYGCFHVLYVRAFYLQKNQTTSFQKTSAAHYRDTIGLVVLESK